MNENNNYNIIELKNIKKKYGNDPLTDTVLSNLSYGFKTGLKTSILGSSGCGKTTLLNLIGGIDTEFEGELLFNGVPIKDFDQYRREHVSFIFQDLNLINHLSLIKNITIGLTNAVENKDSVALDLLERVGLLDHAHKKPHQLSGGERQRVAIARALARDTDILLCDEPTGSLDEETKQEIMALIVEVFKEKTVIFITHDKVMAETYSDVILAIKDKTLVPIYQKNDAITTPAPIQEHQANNKSFHMRFETNLLSKKLSIFNASYLLIIIAAIFIFGTGVIQGVEKEIDHYLYNKYKVDKIDVRTPRFTVEGFTGFIEDFNTNYNGQAIGFMTGTVMNTTLTLTDTVTKNYLLTLQPGLQKTFERDLIYGRFPKSNNEILYSKGAALSKLKDYQTSITEDENTLNLEIEKLSKLSDEELFHALKALDISYRNNYRSNAEQYYDNNLEIVGLIDDFKYGSNYEVVYETDGVENILSVNYNIYMLEEEFQEFIWHVYLGYNAHKFQWFSIFIEEPDLDLRNEVFNDFLTHKNLIFGQDYVIDEREYYYKEIHGYKIAIIGGCVLLSIFAIISIYNGIKTNIQRNRRNIGIYKSLGYTSRNIRSMFLIEGLILTTFITVSTLILWFIINMAMNSHIINALDPNRILELNQIIHLNVYSVLGVIFAIVFTILTSINKELKRVNIINLLRN